MNEDYNGRFPANEHISGASKIPSIIYYDRDGKVRAAGAEAVREGIYETAKEENWAKAEWWAWIISHLWILNNDNIRFKLHLLSKDAGRFVTSEIPPLPLNKTIVEVFADFLRYLLQCASSFIRDTYANGPDLWKSVQDQIDFVLSHPNGWDGTQQSEMRRAAVLADLIPDTKAGHARLSFVTEGEASLHFSLHNGLPAEAMKVGLALWTPKLNILILVLQDGDCVTIVDAGGGTIDVSSYSKKSKATKEKTFEEVAPPQCTVTFTFWSRPFLHRLLLLGHYHGSAFVSIHARLFLESMYPFYQFILLNLHLSREPSRFALRRGSSGYRSMFW